ncbi:MAG: hypothetical protein R3183_06450 [Oleiphilaceae bacterium]|nr:hypothetical protein [Oleiphilaceae bacterium]
MQQVNLYTEEFQPRKVKLPLEQIILLTVVTAIILAGVSVLLNQSLANLQQDVQERQQQADTMRQRVSVMESKAATLVRDESLVLANERLAQQLAARRQMIEVLDKVVVKDDAGYSATLIALARQRVEGLWLTRILLGAAGKNMTLEGATTKADAVPQYLQNLREETSFIGRTFTLFDLNASDTKSGALSFRLRSLGEGNETGLLVSKDGGSAGTASSVEVRP